MYLDYLANHQQHLPELADLYFKEWGYLTKDNSLQKVTDKLTEYLNTDKIPLIVIALENDKLIGAAQLKYREMTIYPEKEHWIGGVYVKQGFRGQHIAENVITKIISDAKALNVRTLYLQTQRFDGGLYVRMGWKPIEKVVYRDIEVQVMSKVISS